METIIPVVVFIQIFICEQDTGTIFDRLYQILSKNFHVTAYDGRYFHAKSNPDFIIVKGQTLPRFTGSDFIVLVGENGHIGRDILENEPFPIIGDSANEHLRQALVKSQKPVIGCGLSRKDTFTLSSINEDRATVSLLRDINTLSGVLLEPSDFPFCLSGGLSDIELLIIAAFSILIDLPAADAGKI